MNKPDFTLNREGNLFLFRPNTEEALNWCSEHLPDDAPRWAGAFAIDQHYIENVVDGAQADGLTVE